MPRKSLKSLRKNRHLTQDELIEQAGLFITRNTFRAIEQGKNVPNIFILKKLTDFFDEPVDLFINNKLPNANKTKLIYHLMRIVENYLTSGAPDDDEIFIEDDEYKILSKNIASVLDSWRPYVFSKNLKTLRKSRHLTQNELVKQAGLKISVGTLASCEIGRFVFGKKKLKKLADFFGISVDKFFDDNLSEKEKNEFINRFVEIVENYLTDNLPYGDTAHIGSTDYTNLNKQFTEVFKREQFIK